LHLFTFAPRIRVATAKRAIASTECHHCIASTFSNIVANNPLTSNPRHDIKLEIDKENRPPRGMAPAGKKNMTPGRQRKKAEAQYFDVGKVGRYT